VAILVLYGVGVWTIAFIHRRRWLSFAAAALSVPPVALFVHVDVVLLEMFLDKSADWLYFVGGAFAIFIAGVALLIAVQPRTPPDHVCGVCRYDLRGNVTGVCPECGAGDERSAAGSNSPEHAPGPSLAVQVRSARRARSQMSSALSKVTSTAPATAAPTTGSQ